MTNLKTLKDLTQSFEWAKWEPNVNSKQLKKEAIKWVKDDLRRIKTGNINVEILLRKWMVRFNLKIEDLK